MGRVLIVKYRKSHDKKPKSAYTTVIFLADNGLKILWEICTCFSQPRFSNASR